MGEGRVGFEGREQERSTCLKGKTCLTFPSCLVLVSNAELQKQKTKREHWIWMDGEKKTWKKELYLVWSSERD